MAKATVVKEEKSLIVKKKVATGVTITLQPHEAVMLREDLRNADPALAGVKSALDEVLNPTKDLVVYSGPYTKDRYFTRSISDAEALAAIKVEE